ncbi:reverse transcriptase [Gossypium australe]|uniref:Reverse transcriptase n=1 Tax=Gossypium australe TaxID=47621 RepID=A0A5B6VLZ2_9ROSI|nr:reverse transcriptase [Gossypium australe]
MSIWINAWWCLSTTSLCNREPKKSITCIYELCCRSCQRSSCSPNSISGFAWIQRISNPLWNRDHQGVIKEILTKALVLIKPKPVKESVIYNDASYTRLGCVLMQKGKVVAYALRQLKPLKILEWKWVVVTMDFVVGLLVTTTKKDAVWTNGQSVRVIQVWEDMLRSCVLEFIANWEYYLPLVEFAYNNSYQASIPMAPFEALYDKVKLICERLKAAPDKQKSYADLKRQDIKYQVGEQVFLKVSPWKKVLRFV